jgi:hypothetical protein
MNLSSRTILLPAIALLIGAVVSTTTASNAYAQEDPFDNKIDEDIDVKHTNSCDETGNGDNNADCEFTDTNDVGDINVEGEENEVNRDINLNHKNDCDESGDGDNNAFCLDDSSTDIGDINVEDLQP